MKSALLAVTLLAATVGTVAMYPTHQQTANTPPPVVIPAEKPVVEVVFALDTTGSMSGLIQGAKENIWSIARTMASAQPTPEIRIGFVAYRDRGDQYVTQVVPLSSDLDQVYAKLMDFEAGGGGDTPEAVNAALDASINQIGWSQNPNAYKVVFLVGDAPAHMDYRGERQYPELVQQAQNQGIVVNTILCGNNTQAQQQWSHMASLNQGQFFRVGQHGNAVAITTPFDEKLGQLAKQLDNTRMFYGDEKDRKKAQRKIAASEKASAKSSPMAAAKRATFNASEEGKRSFLGEKELLEDIASGRVELDAVKPADLPEPLKNLNKKEQQALLEKKSQERQALQQKIRQLAEKRDSYIREEMDKRGDAEESLDYQIYNTIKDQAKSKGLNYSSSAPKL